MPLRVRSRPCSVLSQLPRRTAVFSTSSLRHLSSDASSRPKDAEKAKEGVSQSSAPKRKGVLARILPEAMQPPDNSSAGLRKLISLAKPEKKTLWIAVGLVCINLLMWRKTNMLNSDLIVNGVVKRVDVCSVHDWPID